jgi:hypothetical protein
MENEISDLVNVSYCNAPTILQNFVASYGPRVVPSCAKRFSDVDMGVLIGLQCSIPTHFNISVVYFS